MCVYIYEYALINTTIAIPFFFPFFSGKSKVGAADATVMTRTTTTTTPPTTTMAIVVPVYPLLITTTTAAMLV